MPQPRAEPQRRQQHDDDVHRQRDHHDEREYARGCASRPSPDFATVAAISTNTPAGARRISQPITIIDSSFTPSKNATTACASVARAASSRPRRRCTRRRSAAADRPAPPPRTDSAESWRGASASSVGGAARPSSPARSRRRAARRESAGVESLPRRASQRNDQADDRRDERRATKYASVLPPMRPSAAHVAERRDADEQARDDERHDDHRDQPDEHRAERLERARPSCRARRMPDDARQRPDRDAGDEARRGSVVSSFIAPRARRRAPRASASSVRSTSASADVAHVPDAESRRLVRAEPGGGEHAARALIASRTRFGATPPGSAIAVSVSERTRAEPGTAASGRAPPTPRRVRSRHRACRANTLAQSFFVHHPQRLGDLQHEVHRRACPASPASAW